MPISPIQTAASGGVSQAAPQPSSFPPVASHYRLLRRRLGRLLIVVTLLCLIVVAGFVAFKYFRADQALKAAEKARQKRDFTEAVRYLKTYQDVYPDNPEGHFVAARVARQSGLYEEAKRRLDICQRLEGPSKRIALEQRLIPVQQGAFPVAVEAWLQQFLAEEPPETDLILEALSRGCMSSYRLHNAKSYLTLWLKRDPDNVQPYLWRATIHQHLMDNESAKRDCQRAAELAPENLEAQGRLAQALLLTGEVAEAAEQFKRLFQTTPDNWPIAMGMAQCLEKLGQIEEAEKILDDYVAQHPPEAPALLERGRAALLRDRPAEARPWLEKAAALAPIDRLTQFSLLQCLKQLGDPAEIERCQERLERIDADVAKLRSLTEALQKQPYDLAARCEMARILLRRGEEREAVSWLKETLNLDPTHVETNELLANYFESQGNPSQAARYRALAPGGPPK